MKRWKWVLKIPGAAGCEEMKPDEDPKNDLPDAEAEIEKARQDGYDEGFGGRPAPYHAEKIRADERERIADMLEREMDAPDSKDHDAEGVGFINVAAAYKILERTMTPVAPNLAARLVLGTLNFLYATT